MKFLLKILQGGLIGIAMVIPGFSGGTIAVLAGIYDELIEAISGFRKHPGQSIKTILPIFIGVVLFALLFILPITWGINHYPFVTVSLFAGLLVGGLPSFYENIKGKNTPVNITCMIVGILLVLALTVPSLFTGGKYVSLVSAPWWIYLLLIIIGVVASAALVVPGISGSMFLLLIGFYNPIMDMLKGFFASLGSALGISINLGFSDNFTGVINSSFIMPSFLVCLCFGVGIIIGFVIISKIMKFLLTKYRDATFFAIFGFIAASLFGIYADKTYYVSLTPVQISLALGFFIVGFLAAYFALLYAEKKQKKNAVPLKETAQEDK